MRTCDFCGEKRPLTVEAEPKHVYPEIRVICSACVWKAVARLTEHAPPALRPAPFMVVQTRNGGAMLVARDPHEPRA